MKTRLGWIVAGVLGLLLVISNAVWFYVTLDMGVTLAYRDQSLGEQCKALKACMAIMPRVATGMNRQQVLVEARAATAERDEFEKDGAVWLGSIGLRFAGDRLAEVRPAWEPFECPE